jgi:hypothetical protein
LLAGGQLRQRPVSNLKFIVAALAIFGAATAWALPAPRSATGVMEPATVVAGGSAAAILTDAGFHTSNAIIGSNPLNLQITGEGSAPFLRYAMRGGRIPKALELDRQSLDAAASRARMADLSYLDVATLLAYARAGMAAYRSTAPPHASTC